MYWLGLLVAVGALGATLEIRKQAAGPAVGTAQYIEALSGIRTGRVTAQQRAANTSIINSHLARGEHLRLHAGTWIEVASSLKIGSGGAIIGDSDGAKPTIYLPAAAFDNRNSVAGEGRYAANAVGIDFSGELSGFYRPSKRVRIENLKLLSDSNAGRVLRGIVGRNVTDCVIRNVEISGLPTGIGLALASARRCRLTEIYIHDFADDSAWKNQPQSTGIEIDNDIVRGIGSADTQIDHFRIERLTVSGPLLARWGYQTDGINIMQAASHIDISDGMISNVGEGIDTFGTNGKINNVKINNAYIFGLKFIHGASNNRVRNVTITNAGLAGINFSGSDSATRNTFGNIVSEVEISGIDPLAMWRLHSTAGILITPRDAKRYPVANEVVRANIDLGPNGKYGWLDQSMGFGNRGEDVEIKGGRSLDRPVHILFKGSSVRLRSKSRH